MNNQYQKSTDYATLYELIKAGNEIVGYVQIFNKPTVCFIRIDIFKDILIGDRSADYCRFRENEYEEKDFISECQRLKLEWIVPVITSEPVWKKYPENKPASNGFYVVKIEDVTVWARAFWLGDMFDEEDVIAFFEVPEFNLPSH